MYVEIWSDVVCPWCYIGKRRLEAALAEYDGEAEVVWRSFQLDPGSPIEVTQTVAEHLGSKYGGGPSAGQAMIDNVEAIAAGEGLIYHLGQAKRANTLDDHRLLHLAKESGHQGELKEALLSAYFTKAQVISDHDVLRELAASVGLDESAVDQVLASDRFRDEVFADQEQAGAYGASAVPFFVFNGRVGLSGAQPVEVFNRALAQAEAT